MAKLTLIVEESIDISYIVAYMENKAFNKIFKDLNF